MVCHSLLQWTTFCQTSPPWPVHLGWPHMAWLSFSELDKAVVHVIRLASCLWLWFQSVFPLMPSLSAYHLTIALTIQTFVGIVMSLLFNTLSRFVITFLPRSKRLLISWLQSPSTLILELKKRKSVTTSIFSLSVCHEEIGPDATIFVVFFFNI